ncbi:MAG: pyridoxamine 5'-phosphate oxidase family protein, partial [Bacteroidetes bacterium]|nr:pyridoxamine 5'-phosphate oxidase family protein [Bacteroidota bacterium]
DNDNMPYVVPFNFGYKDNYIYLHSAKEGKKLSILKNNGNVCIAFSTDHKLAFQSENVACSYGMKFRSVLAYGKVEFIEDFNEKIKIMNIIMNHYTSHEFTYSEPAVKNVETFRIAITEMTGKEYGY